MLLSVQQPVPTLVQFVALKLRVVKPLQPEKALFPIDVTELGMVKDIKSGKPKEALSGIIVTLLPIFTVVTPVQPKGPE